MARHRSDPRILNIADKIANGFKPIRVIIHEFQARKLVFNQYQQFQTIKPVGPQIVPKAGFIGDTPDIDAEMPGNKRPDLVDFAVFP